MMVDWFSGTVDPATQRATLSCAVAMLLAFFAFPCLPVFAAGSPTNAREAQIAVMADMNSAGPDQLNIHIIDSTDKDELLIIARSIGTKLHAQPTGLAFKTGDPDFIKDKGIGLDFLLPVVPRGEGYLPLAPIIEALAPHVGKMRLLYIIQGPFTYRGYQQYENDDIQVTVDPPEQTQPNSGIPLAFYGVNAIIKNPQLKTVPIPRYPQDAAQTNRSWKLSPLWWIFIAGALGAGIGVILSKLLPRRQR